MKMEQAECSETSAYKILTPGNYPEENIRLIRLLDYLNEKRRHRNLKEEASDRSLWWTDRGVRRKRNPWIPHTLK